MNKIEIKPYNVTEDINLPAISIDKMPANGDPVEINGELYFVCENNIEEQTGKPSIGVIPLVVRNPAKVKDIEKYINCLSIAHRKVQFINEKGICDLDDCTEMVIS